MPVYDAEDIVELKNRKKRQKRLIKFLVIILILSIAAALFISQDKWLPKLKGIGRQYRTIVNSGQLATGNFPIDIESGSDYQMKYSAGKLFVLGDTSLYCYGTDGKLLGKRQHTYSSPELRVAAGRALLFELGGDDLSVEDEEEVLYTKHFDSTILFARLSSDGYTAVATTSDNYSCEISVFDKKGTCIYERKCIELVYDISFTAESSGCVLSYIEAENGSMVTSLKKISFKESGSIWDSEKLDMLGLEVSAFDGGAFVLGYDSCAYVDDNGRQTVSYSYDGELAGGASMSGLSAVIVNNNDLRKYVAVLFDGPDKQPVIVELSEPSIDVTVFGGLAYVLLPNEIRTYDFSGGLRSTASVSDSYTGFVRSDEHIFLKSYNKIDRIDYES
jgi:hypothetical protein